MVKNNFWFKSRKNGWGWYPYSWQGFTIVAIYISTIIILFYNTNYFSYSFIETLEKFIPQFVIATFILLIMSYLKGEKPHWD